MNAPSCTGNHLAQLSGSLQRAIERETAQARRDAWGRLEMWCAHFWATALWKDWVCSFCGADNHGIGAARRLCEQCATPNDGTEAFGPKAWVEALRIFRHFLVGVKLPGVAERK